MFSWKHASNTFSSTSRICLTSPILKISTNVAGPTRTYHQRRPLVITKIRPSPSKLAEQHWLDTTDQLTIFFSFRNAELVEHLLDEEQKRRLRKVKLSSSPYSMRRIKTQSIGLLNDKNWASGVFFRDRVSLFDFNLVPMCWCWCGAVQVEWRSDWWERELSSERGIRGESERGVRGF